MHCVGKQGAQQEQYLGCWVEVGLRLLSSVHEGGPKLQPVRDEVGRRAGRSAVQVFNAAVNWEQVPHSLRAQVEGVKKSGDRS